MIRTTLVFTLLCVIPAPAAFAAGVSRHQSRTMSAIVKNFSPTLVKADVRTFVDTEAEGLDPMSNSEREARVERSAKWAAEAADNVIRSARANDPEATRAHLNELLRQLARAGGLTVTPTHEEVGFTSYCLISCATIASVFTGFSLVTWSLVLVNGPMLCGGIGLAAGSVFTGLPLINYYEHRYESLRLPGGRRLARLFTNDLESKFWTSLRTNMKEDLGASDSPEALGQSISRELQLITLNQACTSALLFAPPAR